ncbi:ankyrin repeat domain-containing protein 28 [Purpureocillium lavendulum]|uniref:Ankyrin repeat domain-containing protein 28 n=1 Tax=Purpureocillium lavendulum TaxID=1247861 RepID=A0AB34G5W9_9HYPO|nr:ankyrin repeat domain-containing protein 28 [Purpureocillium lavendulum]
MEASSSNSIPSDSPLIRDSNEGSADGSLNDPVTGIAPSLSKPTYAPQFSSAQAWILDRLRNDLASTSKAASQNVPPSNGGSGENDLRPTAEASAAGNVTASTLRLPSTGQPSLQQRCLSDVSEVAKRFIHSYSPGVKRKRTTNDSGTDFSQNTIPFKAPMRRTPLPASDAPPAGAGAGAGAQVCSKCSVHTTTPQNFLVVCHGCLKPFHQQCLSLTASSESAPPKPGTFCQECSIKSEEPSGVASAEAQDRQFIVERIRRKRLAKLPLGVVPAKPELVGFHGKQASNAEVRRDALASHMPPELTQHPQRTEYFFAKTRTELLNVLSLCDQLKPQLLVDILVSVSKKHPDLPIFDDPEWRENIPGAASAADAAAVLARPRVTATAKPRARHGHTLLHPKAGTRKVKGSRKVLKRITVIRPKKEPGASANGQRPGRAQGDPIEEDVEGEEVEEEEEEDALPPTWPRAGEGLYAKLPPENEDRRFLEDENDEEAFSHFMVDKVGKQMIVPACA